MSSSHYKRGYWFGRRARSVGIAGLVGSISVSAVFFMGWTFMLLAGALHDEFGWLRPIGFWPALGIIAAAFLLSSMLRSGVRRD